MTMHVARVLKVGLVLAFTTAGVVLAQQEQKEKPSAPAPGATAKLSAPLRGALIAEMQQVDRLFQLGVSHASRGEWSQLAEAADTIAGAFILKKQLTAEQREELERSLPPEFLALDEKFHLTATRWATAARQQDPELAAFYASQLLESCIDCHTRYVADRFPGLARSEPTEGHHAH